LEFEGNGGEGKEEYGSEEWSGVEWEDSMISGENVREDRKGW
jgi:hypothetical protein